MNSRHKKLLFVSIGVLVILMVAMFLLPGGKKLGRPKYDKEAMRQTISLERTEFYHAFTEGKSAVNKYMGDFWVPMPVPVPEKYQKSMSEKIVFFRSNENPKDNHEMIIVDTYQPDAFTGVAPFLKTHANSLQKKNKNGKIKILHDGQKGIIYQWRVPDKDNKTAYMELGYVGMSDNGVFSVKYINKGTENLELMRQRALKLFGAFSSNAIAKH